jgi:signal transduction histidine kinase
MGIRREVTGLDAGQAATLSAALSAASAAAAGALAALAAWSAVASGTGAGKRGRRLIGLLAVAAAAGAVAAVWWPGWAWPLLATAAWALALALLSRAWRAAWRQRDEARARLQQREAAFDDTRAQLQQALSQAEAGEQARARFLAAASHDLRQPAHALGLYTAALRAGPLAPEQAEIAERMQGSLAALDGLFAALMDLSRIDAGAVLPHWDTVALAPLLRRVADEWAPQAEAKGLRLALHLAPSPADPQAHAVTDPVLLERVVRNLLGNAVKYTAEGGVLLALRLRTSRQVDPQGQPQLRIEVWDSGVGIPPGDQERVFEEFFQRREAATGGERRAGLAGLGLGLAIVQRLGRLLQLRVRLRSRPGHGSVFFVEGLAPAGAVPRAAASSRQESRRLAGLSVAVLEDDPDVRDAMRRLLQLWECRVVDGADASELLARLPDGPQVLLADLRLASGRSGSVEVQQLLQAWGPDIPVLWISGETARDGLRAQLPEGATVLTKPVSPARVRAWLEQRLPDAASEE